MIVSPASTIAGQRIARNLGLVYGNTIRARHVGRDVLAALKNVVGGGLWRHRPKRKRSESTR